MLFAKHFKLFKDTAEITLIIIIITDVQARDVGSLFGFPWQWQHFLWPWWGFLWVWQEFLWFCLEELAPPSLQVSSWLTQPPWGETPSWLWLEQRMTIKTCSELHLVRDQTCEIKPCLGVGVCKWISMSWKAYSHLRMIWVLEWKPKETLKQTWQKDHGRLLRMEWKQMHSFFHFCFSVWLVLANSDTLPNELSCHSAKSQKLVDPNSVNELCLRTLVHSSPKPPPPPTSEYYTS